MESALLEQSLDQAEIDRVKNWIATELIEEMRKSRPGPFSPLPILRNKTTHAEARMLMKGTKMVTLL